VSRVPNQQYQPPPTLKLQEVLDAVDVVAVAVDVVTTLATSVVCNTFFFGQRQNDGRLARTQYETNNVKIPAVLTDTKVVSCTDSFHE